MGEQLRVIRGPEGRVALTTAPFRDEDLEEVLRNQPVETGDYKCRVVLLGHHQRDPIARIWTPICAWAICVPGALDRAMLEFFETQPNVLSIADLQTWFSLTRPCHVILREADPPGNVEPIKFLPELAPRHVQADDRLKAAIHKVSRIVTPSIPEAIEAGLFLMNDCLDESHECSQSIEGKGRHRCGDYWHAIMHRREPDYGNAKYWFQRVGRHPRFRELFETANTVIARCGVTELTPLTAKEWDPMLFVDLCEKHAHEEESPAALALREIQGWEMAHLLEQSITDAVG